MATYRGREVTILQEYPRGDGDQVKIEHKELGLGVEIVPLKDVTVSEEEMNVVRKNQTNVSSQDDFKVELVEKKPTGSVTFPKKDK